MFVRGGASGRPSEASMAWLQASPAAAPEHLLRAAARERAAPARSLAPRSAPAVQSASPEANAARGSISGSLTKLRQPQGLVACRERLNAVSS